MSPSLFSMKFKLSCPSPTIEIMYESLDLVKDSFSFVMRLLPCVKVILAVAIFFIVSILSRSLSDEFLLVQGCVSADKVEITSAAFSKSPKKLF